MHTIETITEYFSTRNTEPVSVTRRGWLERALELGAADKALEQIADCNRLAYGTTVVLPAHRYEGLSRGRGWARKGRGSAVEWGDRVDGGYRVGPGRWTVGGHDGFARKRTTEWDVSHVSVGNETWTVAV